MSTRRNERLADGRTRSGLNGGLRMGVLCLRDVAGDFGGSSFVGRVGMGHADNARRSEPPSTMGNLYQIWPPWHCGARPDALGRHSMGRRDQLLQRDAARSSTKPVSLGTPGLLQELAHRSLANVAGHFGSLAIYGNGCRDAGHVELGAKSVAPTRPNNDSKGPDETGPRQQYLLLLDTTIVHSMSHVVLLLLNVLGDHVLHGWRRNAVAGRFCHAGGIVGRLCRRRPIRRYCVFGYFNVALDATTAAKTTASGN
mmetsp:Transcript_2914/g.8184  ORF Transcript_2914/g.8184 Transcript_2914/m.8184 type:complete len:255 (-) Transcript_2914:1866-2630(-)